MAQLTAITLTDSTAGTPVDRVFKPARRLNDIYSWENRAGGIPAGYDQVTMSFRPPSKTAKATKLQIVLTAPILEQTSASTATGIQPAPTVAFADRVEINVICHQRSSLQNRKDLLAMARDLFSDPSVTAAVHELDMPYF